MILDNFPKVLWINLERSVERKLLMEKLLDEYKLDHTRINAVDGMGDNSELDLICNKNNGISSTENACTCSHILAIKHFVENTTDNEIVIFEDDVSFEFLTYIPYNWSEFVKHLPENYNIIQLCIIVGENNISNILVRQKYEYFSTAAYLIKRETATQLLNKFYSRDANKIELADKNYPAADYAIYSIGNVYSIPIFVYQGTDSIIHSEHLSWHNRVKEDQKRTWEKFALEAFDAEKYFGSFEK